MIILFGPPGSGKSVQGQLLAARHNWRWLSTGQVLRDMHDKEVMSQMEAGKLVDNKVVYRGLITALSRAKDIERIVLDGFPRDVEQARWLLAALPEHQRSIQAAMFIQVSYEEVLRRLNIRGRFDDEEGAIRRRYNDYMGMVGGIAEFLKSERVPVIDIDGVGDVEDIHHTIDRELQKCLQK